MVDTPSADWAKLDGAPPPGNETHHESLPGWSPGPLGLPDSALRCGHRVGRLGPFPPKPMEERMRTRTSLLPCLPLVALALLTACDFPAAPEAADSDLGALVAEGRVPAEGLAVAIPFRFQGYSVLQSFAPDPSCGAPPYFLNTQVGEGQATHLGRFSVLFTFCVDATDLLDDGTLTEGESAPYWNGLGILVAANGDELYVTVEGAVLPSPDPGYDFQFQDPFVIIGGTGRFTDAEGGGTTDSYVTQATNVTEHAWSGTLVMRPGR